MGSWSKAWNKTECLSIPLNRKRRLFYSWAVVLPKFSRKSSLMMRVKTLSKIYQRGGILKGKKVLPLPVVARRSKTLLFPISAPLKHSKKEKRFPVCIKSVSEHLDKILVLSCFCFCCCCFLLVWTCFEVLPIPWEKEIKLQQGKFFDPKQPINNYIQFFLF